MMEETGVPAAQLVAPVTFTLNGRRVSIETDPAKPLLRVLREDLGLTGTKQSCDMEGECGACTVIVDGEAQRSCLLLAGEIAGRSVVTVEGLGTESHPHALQAAFLEVGAVQCGYCTPGMLMSAKALLDRNPRPTRNAIVEALEGNLCRCTGYSRMIQAVERAAEMMAGGEDRSEVGGGLSGSQAEDPGSAPSRGGGGGLAPAAGAPATHTVGGDLSRHQGWQRVSGTARYAEDLRMPGMHYLSFVRSPHFHARVLEIEVSEALKQPGVVRVLTAEDVPGTNTLSDYSIDEYLLVPVGGKVRMLGDPLAIVIGQSREEADAGAASVRVEYEVLPHTFEVVGAQAEDAIQIHESGNLLASAELHNGDAALAFRSSDAVVDATFETSSQAHMALEREAAVAYIAEDGLLTVICGSHEPHWNRGYLAEILGLAPERIRVINPPIGGSFGGKQDVYPMAATALAAYHLRRPVQLAYTRREVMEVTPKRHPYTVHLTIGASAGGTLTALQTDIRANTGAYDSAGRYIADYAISASVGPYRWQAVEARSAVLYSNATKAGQFRGFGSPQPIFALECALDEMAQTLGIDALELRLRNVLAPGEPTGLGFPAEETLGAREVLETLRPDYQRMGEAAAAFNADPGSEGLRRGVGMAAMMYRFGKFGAARSQAEAELGLDGRITIYSSAGEFGQGIETVFVQLAAESLGIPRAALCLVNADTADTLDGDIVGASRATYWVGSAVADAARRLRGAILATASEMLDRSPARLALAEATVYDTALPAHGISLAEVAREMARSGQSRRLRGQMDLSTQYPDDRDAPYLPMFLTGAQAAEVEVDLSTGQARVLQVVAAHDVGKVINRHDASGQLEGGILMAIGSALIEEFVPGQSRGYASYSTPTIHAAPVVRVHLIEVPSRFGVLGVKGLGEPAGIPTAPAVINALSRAAGVRIRRIPATGERVLEALRRQQHSASWSGPA